MNTGLISVILPVWNQADHIARVVKDYEEALARIENPHELILVPNGCRDTSVEVCQELARRYPTVRVVLGDRLGWGRAIKAGLREARGDLFCYTNSARTTAQDLTLFLLYAAVYPDRVIKATRKLRESPRRKIGSLLYNLECRILFHLPFWDINATPKVFSRTSNALLALSRDDNLIDIEFGLICRREKYQVVEVPIFSTRRHGGRSTTSYRMAMGMYWDAIRLWRSMRKPQR